MIKPRELDLNMHQLDAFNELFGLFWYNKPSEFILSNRREDNVRHLAGYIYGESRDKLSIEAAKTAAEVWYDIQMELSRYDWSIIAYNDYDEFLEVCQIKRKRLHDGTEHRVENIVLKGLHNKYFYDKTLDTTPNIQPDVVVVLEKLEINELFHRERTDLFYAGNRVPLTTVCDMDFEPGRHCLNHHYTLRVFDRRRNRYDVFQGEGI